MGSAVGSLAGAALGSFVPGVGTALGASLGGAAGGLLGGRSASQAASGAYGAAAQQQALAAQAAQFRPVGITTNFGSSRFEVDPATGNLVSAGYTLAPQLQGLQTSLLGGFGGALQQAQGVDTSALQRGSQSLYNLGQGYLSESPEAARQRYISQQQALLAPQQEQALAGIRNRLFQTGRTGLATGGTAAGNMAATNPEMAAYYNALAQQQAQLAAGAEAAAQQQASFGQGLLSGGANLQNLGYGLQTAAYSPLQTQLGLGQSIESLGAQSLNMGAELGGRSATAGNNVSDALFSAARTGLAGAADIAKINSQQQVANTNSLMGIINSPQGQKLGSQVGSWFENLIGGDSGPELLNWED
jgi:hypothetical protein